MTVQRHPDRIDDGVVDQTQAVPLSGLHGSSAVATSSSGALTGTIDEDVVRVGTWLTLLEGRHGESLNAKGPAVIPIADCEATQVLVVVG